MKSRPISRSRLMFHCCERARSLALSGRYRMSCPFLKSDRMNGGGVKFWGKPFCRKNAGSSPPSVLLKATFRLNPSWAIPPPQPG
jgi:hypothetical protein